MIRRLIILLLIVGCGTEPEDVVIPGADVVCENVYSDVDSSFASCSEGCELIVDDCYYSNDLDVLRDIKAENDSLADAILLEMGYQIWNNGRLIQLELIYRQLTTIPESIGNLGSLEELSLHYNQLTTIPESIGNLGSLEKLLLYGNQLTTIPESIGDLRSLEGLYLMINQLTTLPESICNLPDDCYISIYSNQLCEEYHYDCIHDWEAQDQSNCCEGENGEPNWTQCP